MAGMKSYTIEKRYKIPRSVADDIKAGKDRPCFFRKPKRKKNLCECCGYREKAFGNRKLCHECFRDNSGEVGIDEHDCMVI